jgi:hypothetical protein
LAALPAVELLQQDEEMVGVIHEQSGCIVIMTGRIRMVIEAVQ